MGLNCTGADVTINPFQAELEELSDETIMTHGFAPHNRDFVMGVYISSELSTPGNDRGNDKVYTFVATVEVEYLCVVGRRGYSLDPIYLDVDAWKAVGGPDDGVVWGKNFLSLNEHVDYVADSEAALRWTARLGFEFHEVRIESSEFHIRLVFHDLIVEENPRVIHTNTAGV